MALGIDGVRVGTWTHPDALTGCTVVLPPAGSLGACAVRGGAPGTREAAALGPTGNVRECHGIVLAGGSAFGLAAADGVVRWCEAHGIGYDKVVARIPIVGAAIVFDLRESGQPRPDAASGWAACEAATEADPAMGAVGVGAGCTVGKTGGLEHHRRSGQGWAVARAGGITVGALMAVNALGDVLAEDGSVLLGSTAPPDVARFPTVGPPTAQPEAEHTVIGCLVTDARLEKHEAARAVDLAHHGIARAVEPSHTTYDGDALFLLATQQVDVAVPVDLVASLGTAAVAAAVRAAARAALAAGA